MSCCKTCKNRLDLEKWDYSDIQDQGVQKTKYDGFACLAFTHEGLVVHFVGTNEDRDMCECYTPKGIEVREWLTT